MGCWCPLEEEGTRQREKKGREQRETKKRIFRYLVLQVSTSKDNWVLLESGQQTCCSFPGTDSHILTFVSIACFALALYLQCVFQGSAISMKQCVPGFHIAHGQEQCLMINSTLLL